MPSQLTHSRLGKRRAAGSALVSVALLVLVAQIAFVAGPASASHRTWAEYTGEPDRGTHTYCISGTVATAVRNRINYSMDNNDGLMQQTNVNTAYYATCTDVIDIRFEQAAVTNAYGSTNCRVMNWETFRCDQWRVRVNWALIQQDATHDDGFGARHTICHEIGHTVGIYHYGNGDPYFTPNDPNGIHSCLRSGMHDGGEVWTRTYSPHERTDINTNWPN